jgi:hypothetical protein
MRIGAFFFAVFVGLPVAASAQRPRIMLPEIKRGDLHNLDPANVVLRNRDRLGLDKSQIARLDTLRKSFEERADQLADSIKRSQKEVATFPPDLKRLPDDKPVTHRDSLKFRSIDSTNSAKTDEYEQVTARGRRDLSTALLALKSLYDDTAERANTILTPDQRVKANQPLADASDYLTGLIRRANIR